MDTRNEEKVKIDSFKNVVKNNRLLCRERTGKKDCAKQTAIYKESIGRVKKKGLCK